jgi:hypothetical protein
MSGNWNCSPEAVAQFHADQIDAILASTAQVQNLAWTASVGTALHAMESGIYGKLFPKRAAKNVLIRAMAARQIETSPSNRWHIACLVESLASLRLLALRYRSAKQAYEDARSSVLRELPHSR